MLSYKTLTWIIKNKTDQILTIMLGQLGEAVSRRITCCFGVTVERFKFQLLCDLID